ncbi:MAG TPA: MOSC N-terminal beta barrel domain-containing protein [Methylomirabilota bacterium]|jgi:hypothetical protein
MHVAELWRYPVKSMAGERLPALELGTNGFAGDRVVHVSGPGGRIISSRTHPRLLGLHARLGPDGEPLVNGHPWGAAESQAAVRAAAGSEARLVRYDGPERFDVLPLLIGTDGAFAELGVDHRRLRPNIVVGGVDGLAERQWPGRRLRIGPAIVEVAKLRARCVMTTYDPDTLEQDVTVLRRIASRFGGTMALDCGVVRGGRIAVGDPVELVGPDAGA